MKVNMFTKEEMHADRAKFRLLVLISKYTRDPWHHKQTPEAKGEWGAFSPSIGPQRKCHANVRPWEAQSQRVVVNQRKLYSWRFELEIFQVGYPVDTHTDMNFLLRVSVTHRPAFARLILGRWKERSLRMKPPSLPIDDHRKSRGLHSVSAYRHGLKIQVHTCGCSAE